MGKNIQYQFRTMCIITFLLATLLLIGNFWIGKAEFFLLLNFNGGLIADYFFKYITYVGDGLMWVPILLYIAIRHRSILITSIFAFIYSTAIAQFFKYVVFPVEPRPIGVIKNLAIIHFVPGVKINDINSFPSGHTTVAFSILLLFASTIKNKWSIFFLFLLACLIAYSRIYLGQHFPLDLAGGIFTAVIAAILARFSSKYIHAKWFKKNSHSVSI